MTYLSDEELDAALENAIAVAIEDIEVKGIDPRLMQDMNGRYILLDAYCALANLRAALRSKNG